ncbi:hypothetical protein KRZ98_07745 [Sphingobium sp. AS12]|uniref:DUF6880 family protein n=1 Tax=Sphingobium sp. AS12 TaxID=2849495 RepID=UPI001C316037|nr:DUF6880 family protein [Sphingobium sp. AS12]MBV2148176.1 hypothetical protein [Sphingobium sp. AS12]
MATSKTLNQTNLEALGAQRLAQLLLELVTGDAQAKRRLRLELASVRGSGDVAGEIGKRLATIAKAKAFVDWHKVKLLAADIETQRRAIMDHVAPHDPATALDLIWKLVALARPVFDRCDDSSGQIGTIFATALPDLAPLAAAAKMPTARLADRVFDSVCDNGYGQFDGLITLMAPVLAEGGLRLLKTRFEAMATNPPKRQAQAERQVIGYGSGGAIYEDDMEIRRHARTVQTALLDIADALGDVDAFIAQYPIEQRDNPAIAAAIAERLGDAGRTDEAMAAIEHAQAVRQKGGHWPDWDRVRIAILDSLGRTDEAQAERWDRFATALDAQYLRAYLKRLPDFDDLDAEKKALAHVRAFPSLSHALHFLLAWPDMEGAAAMVLARADELDGDPYELLNHAAEALESRHPLAATLALRAMVNFALERARVKRYPHAARHLESCAHLACRIDDYGDHPDHETYVAALQAQHGRRRGFWEG